MAKKKKIKLKSIKGNPKDVLKKINKKSKKKWKMSDIKSLAKGYSKKDLKDDKKLQKLIKKVSKAVGIDLNEKQLSSVKKQVHDVLG
ncbi:stage VI sporulation protein F [Brevibacillus choshinensis]|uniref:Stage VI sporulation protein F n=1 Tax=Brevibacillus choshinensis TaxID=54911 RepID=A0ABX7FWS8_BRECH|nr:stage VI sporulation protein F [Brevibacillus choshinensis]QRG69715.1 stage VI sporulation protein F [Brevibacillus choshinensis]